MRSADSYSSVLFLSFFCHFEHPHEPTSPRAQSHGFRFLLSPDSPKCRRILSATALSLCNAHSVTDADRGRQMQASPWNLLLKEAQTSRSLHPGFRVQQQTRGQCAFSFKLMCSCLGLPWRPVKSIRKRNPGSATQTLPLCEERRFVFFRPFLSFFPL